MPRQEEITEREMLEVMTDEQRAQYETNRKALVAALSEPVKRTDLFGDPIKRRTKEERQYILAECLERFYQVYFDSGFTDETGMMTTEAEGVCGDLAHAYNDWLD